MTYIIYLQGVVNSIEFFANNLCEFHINKLDIIIGSSPGLTMECAINHVAWLISSLNCHGNTPKIAAI